MVYGQDAPSSLATAAAAAATAAAAAAAGNSSATGAASTATPAGGPASRGNVWTMARGPLTQRLRLVVQLHRQLMDAYDRRKVRPPAPSPSHVTSSHVASPCLACGHTGAAAAEAAIVADSSVAHNESGFAALAASGNPSKSPTRASNRLLRRALAHTRLGRPDSFSDTTAPAHLRTESEKCLLQAQFCPPP